MASQQTPNYKLSRWAGTDRILVEEFNSDNEKIDAAIKGSADKAAAALAAATALEQKQGLQLIQTEKPTTGATTYTLNFAVDWSQWAEVYVVMKLLFASESATYGLQFTDRNGYSTSTILNGLPATSCIVFYPFYNSAATLAGHCIGTGECKDSMQYKNLKSVTISPSFVFNQGSEILIYGRR